MKHLKYLQFIFVLLFVSTNIFSQPNPENGLVAYYPFNGSATDESDFSNNGFVHGASLTTDRFGNENSAYFFDGIDDYIQIPYDNSLAKIGTITAWINVSENYDEFIFDKGSNHYNQYYDYRLWIGHEGDFMFRFIDENNNKNNIRTYEQIQLNNWVFVCGVYDFTNGIISIYENGIKKAQNNIDIVNIRNSEKEAFIGKSHYTELHEFLNGKIDDIRIYNRPLSDEEIYNLYNETNSCIISDLPFIENANDISGNNNNGIVHGATLTSDRFGNENSAYYFDGVDDNISINNNLLPQEDSERTFSVWFKIKSLNFGDNLGSQMGAIFNYGTFVDSQRFGVLVGGNNSAHPGSLYFVGQYNDFWCNGTYNDNSWHQLVVRYDSYNLDIFVDNTIIETKQITLNTQSYNLIIGQTIYNNTGQFELFNGYIDDFKAFNCALSDEEIDDLYNQPEQCIIANFPFLENANDISGNNNNGTVYGATLTTDRFGNENSAYYLDGVNDYIDLSQMANEYRENMSSLTVSFWVNFEDNTSSEFGKAMISLGSHGEGLSSNAFQFELENNQIQVETETGFEGTNHEFYLDTPLEINKWFYLTCVFDNDTIRYYRDAELISTINYTMAETNSNDLFIGGFACGTSNASCFFNGKIDDVKIFKCALSDQEIEDLYNPNDCSSINISIPNTIATLNSTAHINILSSEIDSTCNIISYSFKINYDTAQFDYSGYNTTGTLAEGNTVTINESVLGELQISCISNSMPFSGEGSLINLSFISNICDTTSVLEISNFKFNDTENTNLENGSVYTTCYRYGDVNTDEQVTAFDAALLMQYVVGNSTEPWNISMPWEDWRIFISDVDAIQDLSANDVVNILEYSVGLITSFPVENNKSTIYDNTNISIAKEDDEYVFYSNGNLKAFELLKIIGNDNIIVGNLVKLYNNSLFSQNNENQYRISMASANEIPKNTKLIKIPINNNNSSITFKTRVNGIIKYHTFNVLSNNAIDNNTFEIFPNPAKQSITINNINGIKINEVFIYNISGKLMLHENSNSYKKEINISNLKDAIYFINIKTDTSTIIKKFVKQK